ncbi:ABC transporter permease [Oceanivirga salmonicida]|uniref:ABC transporter permease n=1 Tax=Oceanivirga salmonicida TaxID=1769291 RepID=UPI00082DFDFD|nr:ABC transporter permease [Oceanivirga salmonicida]
MNILEIVKLSLANLLSFKFRSFLTMLGIIMGIASVVLLSSLGAGFQKKLLSNVQVALSKVVIVQIDQKYTRTNDFKRTDYFTKKDEIIFEKIEGNDKSSLFLQTGALTSDTSKFAQIEGINDKYFSIFSKRIIEGRKFNEIDYNSYNKVVIVSSLTAKRLFKNESAIGKTISLNDFNGNFMGKYKIVGTYNGNMDDQYDLTKEATPYEVLMPANEFTRATDNRDKITSIITISIKDVKKIKKQVELIKKYLEKRGSKKDLYTVKPGSEELKNITNILDKIEGFVNLVASISIIVGGVGVMNIMLVSVKERITEIGLRKAIGAKNKDIRRQFLIETMILTIIGGFIGMLLGYGIAFIIGISLKIIPILKLDIIMTAFIVSSLTGLIFGIYPAKQASKLSPMEALRKE